jgi:N-acetylmuramoyl-L-alanine amidase
LHREPREPRSKSPCRFAAAILLLAGAALAAGQPSPVPAVPQASQSAPQPGPSPARSFIVLLDAAHGGEDSGGHLGNAAEKDYTLALSVRLRSLLAARGIQVVTTRESDATLDANRRAEVANHTSPQACLILHATESGSGVHLFSSSLAPAAPARFTAWKTAQAAWVTRSLALAGVVNSAFSHAGLPVTLGRTSLPTIDSMACPAIAVEIAPNRSAADAIVDLHDPAYQASVAEALAAAILEWKAEARQP